MEVTLKMCKVLNDLGYHITCEEAQASDIDLRDFIMDSLEFVSLIVEIENVFSVDLPDEFLDFEVLASLWGMITAIEALVAEKEEKVGMEDGLNDAVKTD